MAGRRRSGGRAGGAGGKLWGFLVTIFAIALALAFMRANGITDVDGALNYFQSMGREANQIYPQKIEAAVSKSCNFIKDASCLYDHKSQEKIGDVNHDGKINDLDSQAYAKENGVTLNPRSGSDGGDRAASTTGGDNGDGSQAAPPTSENNGGSDSSVTSKKEKDEMLVKLDQLEVAEPDTSKEYKRSYFKHWITVDGACDAREMSLKMVGYKTDPKTCKAQSGFDYVDPYTGKVISDPRKIDIDHLLPLQYTWEHGASKWSAEKRKQYANDVNDVLIPVDASANRQKGAKGPSAWMPSNKVYYCQDGKKWVDVASKYGISITSADKKVLRTAIESCVVK